MILGKLLQKPVPLNKGSQLLKVLNCSFSAGHGPAPTKLPKVDDKIVYLYIKNADSVYEKVPAHIGDSLLECIDNMKVKGFPRSICNGYDMTYRPHVRPHDPFCNGPVCGDCRVILNDNWYERVMEGTDGMSDQEEHILKHQVYEPQQKERLACCVPVEKWMDGMTLEMIQESVNGSMPEFM